MKEINNNILDEFIRAGVQYGHSVKDWNPKMAPYILEEKYGYHIFDLCKSIQLLDIAGDFAKSKSKNEGTLLIVGTEKSMANIISSMAYKINCFYINYRWLGGMLTNWPTIQKRIQRLKFLENQKQKNVFESLSKKEASILQKEFEKLDRFFRGIKNMARLPDLVIFTNQLKDRLAIDECAKLGIPTICLVDSNCNPDLASFPVPCNDDSVSSVQLVLSKLAAKILEND